MDDVAATFAYVDTALGALNRRNHVQRLADVNFADAGAERYISHRRGNLALVEWTRSHTNAVGNPTIEGYDGEVWDTSLPFDFDDRRDPANALGWVRQFLLRLEMQDVPLDALRFYFSGAKGFHVEIPHTLFGGFEPSAELHMFERAAAIELMGGIPFDRAVYDKLRLWRLPNTLNAKGQRYKVQLSLTEVQQLSMPEILGLAEHPRPRLVSAPDGEWALNPYLGEVWARARGIRQPAQEPVVAPTWSDDRQSALFNVAAAAAIAASWPSDPAISRHSDYLLPLAGFLARHMDAGAVAALLKDAVRMSGDTNFLEDRTRRWQDEVDRLAAGSADKIASGQPVEGLPTLSRQWPELAEFLSTNYLARVSVRPTRNGAAAKASGFTFTSLEDMLNEPPEQIAYLVEGMLPNGGVSIWGAKPKVGKSVAVRNLAISVSRGDPFLGRVCQQGAVLVLALEEKRAEVANHFRQMGAIDEMLHLHTGAAPASSKEGLAALEMAVSIYQPLLVIVDPVFKLVRVRDSSDYAELTRELEPVIELARKSHCHIALTHHLGKMVREGGDDLLGSTAIFGAVDTLVLMRRLKDNKRTLQTIQRYGKDLPDTAVPLDETTGLINLGAPITELRLAEAKAKVLETLARFAADYWPDMTKVRETAELDKNITVAALKELAAEGVIQVQGAGKRGDPYRYHLPRLAAQPTAQEGAEVSGLGITSIEGIRSPETQGPLLPDEGAEPEALCRACGKPLSEAEARVSFQLHWGCETPPAGGPEGAAL